MEAIEAHKKLLRDDTVATIKYLSVSMQSNFAKLRTWRCECIDTIWWETSDDNAELAKSVTTKRRHKMVVDLVNDRIATGFEQDLDGSTDSSLDWGDKKTVQVAFKQVVTPVEAMTCYPGHKTAGIVELPNVTLALHSKIQVSTPKGNELPFHADGIDPRNYFCASEVMTPWKEYDGCVPGLEKGGDMQEKMMRFIDVSKYVQSNERVVYRVAFHNIKDGKLIKEQFHDSTVPGNIVRVVDWTNSNEATSHPRQQCDYTYAQVDGIFLPMKCIREFGYRKYRRELVFENHQPNSPVRDEDFGRDFLALKMVPM